MPMRLENIHHSFDSRGIAGLHGVDLKPRAGEIFAIVGPNGAGKTTLLRVLRGDLRPQKGTVVEADRCAWLDSTSLIPHEANVQTWLIEQVHRSMEAEKKLQLARDMADAFEFTFQLKLTARELSDGLLQRVKLAGALIDRPDLLLLDEPFSHLDTPTRESVLAVLKPYLREREIACVWITHQREDALAWSDRMGLLYFGKWEQVGPPEEMFFRPRTVFAARFMGHENLVTVTRPTPASHWQTPLGNWDSQGIGMGKTHLVMAIPPGAFNLDPNGFWSGQVLRTSFKGHHGSVYVRAKEHEWVLQWAQGPGLGLLTPGREIRFNVNLEHAIGIDCL